MENEVKINVQIKNEIYSNDNFIVYMSTQDNGNDLAITTNGFELRPGKALLVGKFTNYKGKKTFKCLYEEFDSTSYDSKYNLLCSIKGIKDNTAKKILDNIPDSNLEIFYKKDCPKIKGIGPAKMKLIHEGLKFLNDNKNLKKLVGLLGNNVTSKKLHELNNLLIDKEISIDNFKNDPYEILIENLEMSFKKVDFLAIEKFKCSKHLRSRILYLSEQIVNTITQFGNTFVDIETFTKKLDSYHLKYDNLNDLINSEDSKIVNDSGRIQTKLLAKSENEIPKYINNIKNNIMSNYELLNVDLLIAEYQHKNNIKLHEMQKQAVKTSIENGVSIIAGGAGVGKTVIIKCIIYILKKLGYKTLCTAPTGKASRRMAEATNEYSYTCHRFYYGDKNIDWGEGFKTSMIIDEFSMVDSVLFFKILKSMDESKTNFNKLILVGDSGQLPSVGAGSVMSDLIQSKKINITTLTNTFRQKEDSIIIDISKDVRHNKPFKSIIKKSDFFMSIKANTNDYILRCWISKFNKIKDLDILYDDFQICTSSRRRCNEINYMIRKENNNQEILLFNKDTGFSLNDKIMCIKNDYENDVYNGEFGRILKLTYEINDCIYEIKNNEELKSYYDKKIFGKNLKFFVYYSGLEKSVSYDLEYDELEKFTLSYCCTIHKLQGSEFKNVLCDVSDFNMITDSRLLYTAITRAKNLFILVSGNIETINKIVKNRNSSKRNTLLLEKFKNYDEEEIFLKEERYCIQNEDKI